METIREQLDNVSSETEDSSSPSSEVEETQESEVVEEETTEEEETPLEEESEKEETEEEEEVSDKKEFKPPSLVTRVKQKYGKEIFKEFPELEDAYFKWKEVSQIHGTIDDVKNAHQKALYLDNLAGELVEGNLEPILDGAYEIDPNSVAKIAHSFLPLIREKSPKLFASVVQPIVVNFLAKVAKDAQAMGNENLLLAVRHINNHAFDDSDVPRAVKIPKIERTNDEIRNERVALQTEKENNFYALIERDSISEIDSSILSGLDPKKVLPEGLREVAVDKIRTGIFDTLRSNREHMNRMAALKRTAMANGYAPAFTEKVTNEVVKSAKELIPIIRSKVIKELGISSTLFPKNPQTEKTIGSPSSVINTGGNGPKIDASKIDFNKTSIRDALGASLGEKRDIHYRK